MAGVQAMMQAITQTAIKTIKAAVKSPTGIVRSSRSQCQEKYKKQYQTQAGRPQLRHPTLTSKQKT